MKMSEDFRKEAMLTHITLVLGVVVVLVGITIALVNGKIVGLAFLPFLFLFVILLVVCYRGDKKTYEEIQDKEAKEEKEKQHQHTV